MQTEEQQLIDRVRGGRTEEFGYLIKRYGPEVFALAARMVGTQQDAEEVAQDAFLKAFERLDSFHGDALFSTWLCRIAYNCAVSFLRRNKRYRPSLSLDGKELAEITDQQADEALSAEKEEQVRLLEQAIGLLPTDDQTLLSLFYYDNRSLRDIAYIMGQPADNGQREAAALATRLFRIRKRLCLLMKQIEHGSTTRPHTTTARP